MMRRRDKNSGYDKKKVLTSLLIILTVIALLIVLGAVESKEDSQSTETSTSTLSATTTSTTSTTTQETESSTETTTKAIEEISVVPEGATVEKIGGKWGLYKDGALISNYTGIASNSFGDWYVVHGLVDFNYTGNVKSNGKSYNVSGGKVIVPTTVVKKTTTTTVKYSNLPSGVRDLVLRSERYATKHIDKNFTNKYKFDQTWGSIEGDTENYVNELPPKSNNAVVNVYFNAADGKSATFTFSSEYGGVLKLKYVYVNSSSPTASPLGNED